MTSAGLVQTDVTDANGDVEAATLREGVDGAVVKRFWVSLSEQVENFAWDPSVGTAADNVNAPVGPVSGAVMVGRGVGAAVAMIVVMMIVLLL